MWIRSRAHPGLVTGPRLSLRCSVQTCPAPVSLVPSLEGRAALRKDPPEIRLLGKKAVRAACWWPSSVPVASLITGPFVLYWSMARAWSPNPEEGWFPAGPSLLPGTVSLSGLAGRSVCSRTATTAVYGHGFQHRLLQMGSDSGPAAGRLSAAL